MNKDNSTWSEKHVYCMGGHPSYAWTPELRKSILLPGDNKEEEMELQEEHFAPWILHVKK